MDAAMIVTLRDTSETHSGHLHDADWCHGTSRQQGAAFENQNAATINRFWISQPCCGVGGGQGLSPWPISTHRQGGGGRNVADAASPAEPRQSEAQSHCAAELL
jgi:hypothetical protein